jgi:phage shock protein A
MAEAIHKRLARLFSSTVQDAVDRMEVAGSDRVMRETIREVDRASDLARADHEEAVSRRLLATRQQKMLREKAAELQDRARFALGADRADLAEAALTRQLECEDEAGKLEAVQAAAQEEATRLAETMAALAARKAEMEQALVDFLGARRDARSGGDGPTRVRHDIEQRVHNAEEAFRRALLGAGGVGLARGDIETTNRVAEIDVMRRRAAIAGRLAALRDELTSV